MRIVQRLGYIAGYSHGALALILDRLLQAGHIPSWRRSYGSYALSPAGVACRWLLLLLSPLLSAVRLWDPPNYAICLHQPDRLSSGWPGSFRVYSGSW